MANRPINFTEGEYYHIYNRGTDKRNIFLDRNDYERFLVLLFTCNRQVQVTARDFKDTTYKKIVERYLGRETLVDIVVYCLMPNHFHLLIREKKDGNTSLFMQKLATAYSMYFNCKYERNGRLFQGTFKAELIDNDPYFNHIFTYISLNPLSLFERGWKEKEGITDIVGAKYFLNSYQYSSYLDHIGLVDRPEKHITNREALPDFLIKFKDFEESIDEWFNEGKEEYQKLFGDIKREKKTVDNLPDLGVDFRKNS